MSKTKKTSGTETGHRSGFFRLPYGDYQAGEVAAAEAAGYLFANATISGPLQLANDFYRIRRINMMTNDRGIKFWKTTSGWDVRYCRWKG